MVSLVVVMEFFVVLVHFQMRRMMMNWRTMRHFVGFRVGDILHRVIREHVACFGNQMPNLVPVVEVYPQQWSPSGVVHQLAYGWQFVLQQQWVQLLGPHTWIQPYFYGSVGSLPVGCRTYEFPGM